MTDWKVTREDLAKLPHIDAKAIGRRSLPMFPAYLDDAEGPWGLWAPGPPDGRLVRLKGGEPVEGEYFSKAPVQDDDVYFDFLDKVTQHLSWPELNDTVNALRNDIYNLAAALATLRILHDTHVENKSRVARCAQVQIEFILTVCRSMYDLAQEFLADFHHRIQWKDSKLESIRKGATMPRAFSKVALSGDALLPASSLVSKWGIEPKWAEFYVAEGKGLLVLRRMRDDIVHHGGALPYVYVDNRGFSIDSREAFLGNAFTWPPTQVTKNGLAPLMPLLAHLINESINMLNRMTALLGTYQLPAAVAPGWQVFMRGPHIVELANLPVRPEDEPWFRPEETMEPSSH